MDITFEKSIPPQIKNNLLNIFLIGKLGLAPITIKDIKLGTTVNEISVKKKKWCHNFKLKLPYASKSLNWEVVFDPEDFYFPPDFDFNDDHFPTNYDPDYIAREVPSLKKWDVKDSKSLYHVLKEFLNLYKKTHLDKLKNDNIYSKIYQEYTQLLSGNGITDDRIEIVTDSNGVLFFIALDLDVSKLPHYQQSSTDINHLINPLGDFVNLRIHYAKLDGSKVNTYLQICPRLEQILGNLKRLHIPAFTKEQTLLDYVNIIHGLLDGHIREIREACQFRKEYIGSLVNIRSLNILEYDSTNFLKASFLCCLDNFWTVVEISTGPMFPRDRPVVCLKSIYCTTKDKKPCQELVVGFAHNLASTADDMVKNLLISLEEPINKFKQHKHAW